MKAAKTGGKDETASPKGESKADSIGDAVLTVNNVGKSQDGCELGSGGSVYETGNKATRFF